jgi:HEAT repeat protein
MQSLGQWVGRLVNTEDRYEYRENSYDLINAFAASLGPDDRVLVPELIEMLRHPHHNVREAAAEGLCTVGTEAAEAVPALLLALGDKDFQVQVSAARALGRIAPADPAVIQAFIGLLTVRKDDLDLDRHDVVVDGLRAAGAASVRPLADCLASPDVELRREAACVLCQMGHEIAPTFKDLVAATRDPDAAVRVNVARALGEFRGHPQADEAVHCLIELVRDEAVFVRGRAVCYLGVMGIPGRKALPVLEELASDEDFYHDLQNPRFLVEHVLSILREAALDRGT